MASSVLIVFAAWAVCVSAVLVLGHLLDSRRTTPNVEPVAEPTPARPTGDVVPLVPRPRNGLAPVAAAPLRRAS